MGWTGSALSQLWSASVTKSVIGQHRSALMCNNQPQHSSTIPSIRADVQVGWGLADLGQAQLGHPVVRTAAVGVASQLMALVLLGPAKWQESKQKPAKSYKDWTQNCHPVTPAPPMAQDKSHGPESESTEIHFVLYVVGMAKTCYQGHGYGQRLRWGGWNVIYCEWAHWDLGPAEPEPSAFPNPALFIL